MPQSPSTPPPTDCRIATGMVVGTVTYAIREGGTRIEDKIYVNATCSQQQITFGTNDFVIGDKRYFVKASSFVDDQWVPWSTPLTGYHVSPPTQRLDQSRQVIDGLIRLEVFGPEDDDGTAPAAGSVKPQTTIVFEGDAGGDG